MEIECPVCNKEFATKYSLKRHMDAKHPAEKVMVTDNKDNEKDSDEYELEEDENEENQWKNDYWRYLIETALEEMDELPETFVDLMKEENFMVFLKRLRNIKNWFEDINYARRISKIRKQLQTTEDKFIEDGYNASGEAEIMAWKNRVYLFKTLMRKNKDLYKNMIENSDTVSDQENESNEGETDDDWDI